MDLLEESERVSHFPVLGATRHWHVRVGDRQAEHAAIVHTDLPETHQALRQHLSFKWSAMGAWFEEEEQVIVHPRDPYKRIDILQSSRKVRIELDGVVIASSESPVLLFETGLPTRFYLRRQDFNDDLLIPSDLTTGCPYKGFASYYSLRAGDRTHQDLIWCYESPLPESSKIKGLLSAFNERVDLYVDDELQPRPQTPWS